MNRKYLNLGTVFTVVLLAIAIQRAPAIDLNSLPSKNPEVVAYTYDETLSLLHYWKYDLLDDDDGKTIPFHIGGIVNMTDVEGMNVNGMFGSVIGINQYFAIPLFFSMTGGYTYGMFYNDKHSYFSLFTGGGLLFSNSFMTLGAFAGYHNLWGNVDFSSVVDDGNFKFGVIPLLNTVKIPLLRYILKEVQGTFNFGLKNLNKEPEFDLSGLAAKFSLREFYIEDLSVKLFYNYKDEYRSFVTRQEVHSGELFLVNESLLGLTLGYELGYRRIYEAVKGAYYDADDLRYNKYINGEPYWSHTIYFGISAFRMQVLLKLDINPVDGSFGILADIGKAAYVMDMASSDDMVFGGRYRGGESKYEQ
jgi:hypothetical protein